MSPYEVKLAAMVVASSAGVAITGIVAWTVVKLRRPNEGASPAAAELQGVHERLGRLEDAVESVALELERSGEAQRFTARLLADRLGDGALPHAAERAADRALTPHRPVRTPH